MPLLPSAPPTRPRRVWSFQIAALTLSALCAGCQSFDAAQNPRVERTPRLVAGLSRGTPPRLAGVRPALAAYDGEDVWARLGQGCTLLDENGLNDRIQRQRDWLLGNPGFLNNASLRASPYLHFIVERLDERQMPVELALLPIVESAYNPLANSPKSAAGLWQFMPATGRDFNLLQTASYDGRRDVLASSKAAMDYLTRLHEQFNGDWLLALAAYNAGEGTVARAVEANQRRGLPVDYWHLNLPRETQEYVPRLLALSLLVRDPQRYGVQLNPVANAPYFEAIEVNHAVDIAGLAANAGIDAAQLLRLNPAFLRQRTQEGPGLLLVPRDQARLVAASLSRMGEAGERLAQHVEPNLSGPRAVPFDKPRSSVTAHSSGTEQRAMRAIVYAEPPVR